MEEGVENEDIWFWEFKIEDTYKQREKFYTGDIDVLWHKKNSVKTECKV